MKIIQLMLSLVSGGGERFVVDLSNELASKGHDVTICILRDDNIEPFGFNKQFISPSVKFHSLKLAPGFSISKVYEVSKYIKSQNPDILHCHLNVIPYIYPLALTNRKIKIFHTLHNVAEKTCGGNVQKSLNRVFYKRYITPITISKECQISYQNFYNLYNAPFIDNGRAKIIKSNKFEDVEKEVSTYKAHNNTPVFIHIARFAKQKNQDLLIDAFNKINEENVDFSLLVIGNGFQSSEAQQLKQRACSKIHFLGEKNNIGDYLLCSNAFCLTSIYEGLPITLLEALSVGVTPICTAVGGIPDVIENGKHGYLSTDINIDSYTAAIKRFIKNPIPQQVLIQLFEEKYSMQICANRYIELYKKNN